MNESRAQVEARMEQMIAEGKASPEDEFVIATWDVEHPE
jgi:hypothetical protein